MGTVGWRDAPTDRRCPGRVAGGRGLLRAARTGDAATSRRQPDRRSCTYGTHAKYREHGDNAHHGPHGRDHRRAERAGGRRADRAELRRVRGPRRHRPGSILGQRVPRDRGRRGVRAPARRAVAGLARRQRRPWLWRKGDPLPGSRVERVLLPGGRLHRLRRRRSLPQPGRSVRPLHDRHRAGARMGTRRPGPARLLDAGRDHRAPGRLLRWRVDGAGPRWRRARSGSERRRSASRHRRHPRLPRRHRHLGRRCRRPRQRVRPAGELPGRVRGRADRVRRLRGLAAGRAGAALQQHRGLPARGRPAAQRAGDRHPGRSRPVLGRGTAGLRYRLPPPQ